MSKHSAECGAAMREHARETLDALQAHSRTNRAQGLKLGENFSLLWGRFGAELMQDSDLLWEIYPLVYDALRHLAPYRELQEQIIMALDLGPEMNCTSLGCGTASLEQWLIAAGGLDAERTTLVDFSDGMLDQARRNLQSHPETKLKQHDLNQPLSFLGTASQDRVVCSNVLGFLQPEAAENLLAEIRRVLKPRIGKLVLTTQKSGFDLDRIFHAQGTGSSLSAYVSEKSPASFATVLESAFGSAEPGIQDDLSVVQLLNCALFLRDQGVPYAPDADELQKALEEAGFEVAKLESAYADQYHLAVAEASPKKAIQKTFQVTTW